MKGIIVAAGYGTRFLPVTKTIPKEMLPLIDKPSIAFIIEEMISSGISDIIIISSRRKKSLEDYLDREVELENIFKKENAEQKLEKIEPYKARFTFVRQQEMKGTGHALMQAAPFVGNEPVVIAYPDDLHFGDKPLTAQLIEQHKKTGGCVMATIHNPPNLERYGVLKLDENGEHVLDMVEKPAPGTEPSQEVSIGRFLMIPEFFQYLEEGWQQHTGGEYYHLYALKKLMAEKKVTYKETEGERLDTGEPAGYLKAIIHYAKQNPELTKVLQETL